MPPKKSPAGKSSLTPKVKASGARAPMATIPAWQARLEERVAFTYDPSIEDIASTKTYHEHLVAQFPEEAAKCSKNGTKTYAQIYTSEDFGSAIQAAWGEACGKRDNDGCENNQCGDVVPAQLIKQLKESFPLRVTQLSPSYAHRPSRIVSIREGTKLPDTLVMWAAFDFVLLPTHTLLVHIIKLHCRGGDRLPPPQRRPRAIPAATTTANRVYEIMAAIPVKHCFLEGMHFIHPRDVTNKFEKEMDTFVFQSIVDATHFSRTSALIAERQGLSRLSPCHQNANPARLECYCNPLIGFGLASRIVLQNAVSSVESRDEYVKEEGDLNRVARSEMCLNGNIVVMGMGGNVVCNALVDTFLNPFAPEALRAAMAAATSSTTGNSATTITINRVKQFLEDNPLFRIHVVEIEPAVFDVCVDAGVAPETQIPQSKDLYNLLSNVPKRNPSGSFKKAYVTRPQDLLENECHFKSEDGSMTRVFNEARSRVVFHIGVDALATSPTSGQSIIGDRLAQLNNPNSSTSNSSFSAKYTPMGTAKLIFMDCYDPVVSTMVHPSHVIQMLKPLLDPKGGMLVVNTHVSSPESGKTQHDRNNETAAAFLPFASAFPFSIANRSSSKPSSSVPRITDSLVVVMRNTGLSQHLVSCMRYDASTTTTLKEPQQLEIFAKQHTMEKLSSAINEMVEGNTPMGVAISQFVGRVLIGTPSSIAASQQAAVSKIAEGESDRSRSTFNVGDVSFLLNKLWGISKGELVLCKDDEMQLRCRVRVYTSIQ